MSSVPWQGLQRAATLCLSIENHTEAKMKITHVDIPALRDQPLFQSPLFVIAIDTLEAELAALHKALQLPANAEAPDMEDDEWQEVMERIIDTLPPTASTDSGKTAAHLLAERERQAVAHRMTQACRALRYASGCVDGASNASGLLLPVSYAHRVREVLGYGNLPLAWVRAIDVARF